MFKKKEQPKPKRNTQREVLSEFVSIRPILNTQDIEYESSHRGGNKCSFTFIKDGISIECHRRPVIEIDKKQFCKLHSEVYVLENFDLGSNMGDPDTEHK